MHDLAKSSAADAIYIYEHLHKGAQGAIEGKPALWVGRVLQSAIAAIAGFICLHQGLKPLNALNEGVMP